MSWEFGHTAVMVMEPGAEIAATWRPPGWGLLDERLVESAQARLAVCLVIRGVSPGGMQQAEVGLQCERREVLQREVQDVGSAISAVTRLWEHWRWLWLSSQAVASDSSSGRVETTFGEKRFVKDVLELQVRLLGAVRKEHRLSLLAGLSGMDGCEVGGFRESCWHLAVLRFLISTHNAILDAARTGRVGRRRTAGKGPQRKRQPQCGRATPRSWSDIAKDDKQILRAIGKGYGTRDSAALAAGCSKSHLDKRLRDLREWGLVAEENCPYRLTETGEEWDTANS